MYPQTQNMITIFPGYTNIMTILLFIFFVLLGAPTTRARHVIIENPLVELSTSDDLRRVAGYGDEKLSTVVITGSVSCYACFAGDDLQSHPIPGASIAVSCNTRRKTRKSDWIKGTTDEYGDFLIDLPSRLHALPHIESKCIVRIIGIPKTSPCHQAHTGALRGIKFSSVKNGFRTYTTDEIHLKQKSSHTCVKKLATFM